MTVYFLDTGFLIALEAVDDQHHDAAIKAWRDIRKGRMNFVTTTYVFDEVTTFLTAGGITPKPLP